jgi:hypothetical protein
MPSSAELPEAGWRPTSEAPERSGMTIYVRSIEVYRFHPYKPDGQRQMGRPGRWQKLNDYGGWDVADLPSGEFMHVPIVGSGD